MENLQKIGPSQYIIPKTGDMKVGARIFASEKLLKDMKKDRTLDQIKNVAKPDIKK